MGKESILQLARHNPAKIYMGARSEVKANLAISVIKQTVPETNIIFLHLNLASFTSIKGAADKILSDNERLDILMNNAGVMMTTPGLTEDGYEINLGTNHMGSALLTKLLLPLLARTASSGKYVRIINASSALYNAAPKPGILFERNRETLGDLSTLSRYGQSNLQISTSRRSLQSDIQLSSRSPCIQELFGQVLAMKARSLRSLCRCL